MKKGKRKKVNLRGCPKCGGPWERVSGFYRCQKCQHVHGSQNPEIDWRRTDVIHSNDGLGFGYASGRTAAPSIEKTADDKDSPHPYMENYPYREMK